MCKQFRAATDLVPPGRSIKAQALQLSPLTMASVCFLALPSVDQFPHEERTQLYLDQHRSLPAPPFAEVSIQRLRALSRPRCVGVHVKITWPDLPKKAAPGQNSIRAVGFGLCCEYLEGSDRPAAVELFEASSADNR